MDSLKQFLFTIFSLFTLFVTNPGKMNDRYPWHTNITATIFWVGEKSSSENDFIANNESMWDKNWQKNFGGVDDPDERDGFYPRGFIPKQNPFYIALPYNDLRGKERKESAKKIPWFKEDASSLSIVKNRWLRIRHKDIVCYGQWEDVGPFETDDFTYVFANKLPKNREGVAAGIDLSPATHDCLGVDDTSKVDWQFVDFENVPEGPWKEIITRD